MCGSPVAVRPEAVGYRCGRTPSISSLPSPWKHDRVRFKPHASGTNLLMSNFMLVSPEAVGFQCGRTPCISSLPLPCNHDGDVLSGNVSEVKIKDKPGDNPKRCKLMRERLWGRQLVKPVEPAALGCGYCCVISNPSLPLSTT